MGRGQSIEPTGVTRPAKRRRSARRFLTRCGAILLGAALVAGAELPASAATPTGTLDQGTTPTPGAAYRDASDGTYQVFTAGLSGVFTNAELYRDQYAGSGLRTGAISVSVVTVANGWPTTTVLGSGQFAQTTTIGWQSASFATPFTVTAGQQYALKLTPQSTMSIATATSYPGVYEIDEGVQRSYSLAFRTYVDTTRMSPVFTATSPPWTGTVNTPYPTYTFAASGTPAPTFALASGSLPTGLTLDSATGKLAGTPTHAGAATFTVRASNGINPSATSNPQTITIGQAAQTVTITSTPPTDPVVGTSYDLTATGGASGNPVTYTTTTPGVCSVTGATVTSTHIGSCVITANQAGNNDYLPATATQTITIGQAAQTVTITSTPPADPVAAGSTYNMTATGGASGNPVTFSTTPETCSITGATVTFTHTGSCVITADQAGNNDYLPATATQTITVVAGPVASLSITPTNLTVAQGDAVAFTITGTDAGGNPVDTTNAILTSRDSDTIDGHTILFSGAGDRIVTATLDGVSTSTTVHVIAGPLANLSLSPATATVIQGTTAVFTLTGTDAAGNPVDVDDATLTAAPTDTVNGHSIRFSGAGVHTVTASLNGVSTTAEITVIAGPLSALTITPATQTVTQGDTTTFTVTGTDTAGNPVDTSGAVLSSNTPADTITGTSVTFSGAGTHIVTATLNSVSTSASIEVVAGPLASLTVTPATATVTQGDTTVFTINGADAAGNPVNVDAALLTSTAEKDVVDGRAVTFSGAGTRTITATLGDITATATIDVTPGPVATLTLSPTTATLTQGDTIGFTITGADTAGNPVDTTAAVLTSSNRADTVDGRTVTFSGAGTHTITATLEGVTTSATIDVTAGPLATLTLTPATATVTQGDTTVFTVTGSDAAGNPVNTDTAALTSSATTDRVDGRSVAFSGAGTRTITATLGTITTTATIDVTPGPVATLTLTPSTTTVTQGGTIEFTITGKDAAGNPVDTADAVLTSTGITDTINGRTIMFSGADTHTITATLEGVTAVASIDVTPGPAASLTITPSATTVDQGGSLTFAIEGADAAGNPVDTSTAALTSSIPTDVITGTTVTFPHASPHTITATLGALTATVTIQVTPAAAPSPTTPPTASAAGLANTGLDGGTIGATGTGALALLLAGAALLLTRRKDSAHATQQRSRP